MRSIKEDAFYKNRKQCMKEYRENKQKREWLGALRALHLALLRAEVERETAGEKTR